MNYNIPRTGGVEPAVQPKLAIYSGYSPHGRG